MLAFLQYCRIFIKASTPHYIPGTCNPRSFSRKKKRSRKKPKVYKRYRLTCCCSLEFRNRSFFFYYFYWLAVGHFFTSHSHNIQTHMVAFLPSVFLLKMTPSRVVDVVRGGPGKPTAFFVQKKKVRKKSIFCQRFALFDRLSSWPIFFLNWNLG